MKVYAEFYNRDIPKPPYLCHLLLGSVDLHKWYEAMHWCGDPSLLLRRKEPNEFQLQSVLMIQPDSGRCIAPPILYRNFEYL